MLIQTARGAGVRDVQVEDPDALLSLIMTDLPIRLSVLE